jgi:1,4-dihydroxy-2-naphthoate octaprenyltransferase
MVTRKEKNIAWFKATRPQFLFAYIVLGIGGIALGTAQFRSLPSIEWLMYSFAVIILAAIGIHFRDEAADWIAGFDREHGGVGVIRDGILEAKPLQNWGRALDIVAIGLALVQTWFTPILLVAVIPSIIIIVGSNYITERIPLGHEVTPALAFMLTLLWTYLGQGWHFTIGTVLFVVFTFVIIFALVPYQDVGDYEADKQTGKKTLTVKLGIDHVGLFSILIALLAMLVLFAAINYVS